MSTQQTVLRIYILVLIIFYSVKGLQSLKLVCDALINQIRFSNRISLLTRVYCIAGWGIPPSSQYNDLIKKYEAFKIVIVFETLNKISSRFQIWLTISTSVAFSIIGNTTAELAHFPSATLFFQYVILPNMKLFEFYD